MNKNPFLMHLVEESLEVTKRFFEENMDKVERLAEMVREAHATGHKVLVAGNGGSAADAQHFAAELMHRVEKQRIGVQAFALHTDTSLITAIANDEGYRHIYSRQVQTLAGKDDLLVAISTSGSSPNVVEALIEAHKQECKTVGLLGHDGGTGRKHCDLALIVPSTSTPRIQEVHSVILHLVCQMLEKQMG